MKKKLLIVGLIAMLAICFTACGNSSSSSSSSTQAEKVTYSSILKSYTAKMKAQTPKLVKEYKSKSSGITDINKLAKICNDEVEKLAATCNDGVSEMADLKLKNNDSDDTYTEWAKKLQDRYSKYASKIQKAYTDSAT